MASSFEVDWVSSDRFARYLSAANGDVAQGERLYRWNARVAAALLEVIHHFEVLLRNSITSQLLGDGSGNSIPGTPWLQNQKQINEVVARLRRNNKQPTPGRIYSNLSFGIWNTMFGTEYEELWRHSLRFVFKHSHADRSTIASYLNSVNMLRNRIAHHGCLLDIDPALECRKLVRLSSWIDPAAGRWIDDIETVSSTSRERPVPVRKNVLLVGSQNSWDLVSNRSQRGYEVSAVLSIRPVEYIGFYADKEIKPTIYKVVGHEDAVDWNKPNSRRLKNSPDSTDKLIGNLVASSLAVSSKGGAVNQVYILSENGDPETVVLENAIEHLQTGQGSAFVKLHRYTSLASLKSARSTADLQVLDKD